MVSSPTLREVAEQARVSIGTASQALNNRSNVAPETRARVVDTALALGYPIKTTLSDEAEVSVATIGLFTKHDFGLPVEINPFYSCIQLGVESECRKRHISLMFASVEVDPSNRPLMWPVLLNEPRGDGLILAGTLLETAVDFLGRRRDIPVVLIDGYAPALNYDNIVIDNAGGAAKLVNHLVMCGHKHIGIVGFNPQSPLSARERYESYVRTLQSHGIQQTYVEESGLSRESGYEATRRLLKRAPQVTAIFACNDLVAVGAIHGIRSLGLETPRDVSVVGFDDIDLAADVLPALTTVRVPKLWLGSLAVRQLIARIQNPDQPQLTLTVSTQLILRDSVLRMAP